MTPAAQPSPYFTLNMDWTIDVLRATAENKWLRMTQKVALATLFPLLMIAAFEAVVKNGFFLVAKLGIAATTQSFSFLRHCFSK